jgi:hypothetical protein
MVSGQLHARAALTPKERGPSTHWIGGWVGLGFSLDAVEKRKILHCQESNPGHPACPYTDRVIRTPKNGNKFLKQQISENINNVVFTYVYAPQSPFTGLVVS